MKISSKKYALSLYELVKGKNESELKQIINEFVKILFKNKDLKKADEIIANFIKISEEHDGIVNANIITAKELDNTMVKILENYIKEISLAKMVKISEVTDKSILGGVVITYGDNVLDGSLKTKLSELKKTMIK